MASAKTSVEVDGRTLQLTNLDKVLYPETGFTKGEVIDYYRQVADVLLPRLADRLLTRKRWPDGTAKGSFFEKNAPRGTPEWVTVVNLPSPGSSKGRETIDYVVVDDLPTLVWLANLAALELHVPQWTVGRDGDARGADLLVFDLDPGEPATVVECCHVAGLVRELLNADGLDAFAKTSGNKGLQLYVPIAEAAPGRTSAYAKELAQRLEAAQPDLVVHRMTKALRPGKVLVDWSQNNPAKTTVAAYSLRARETPTVSTPISWDEVGGCRESADLRFTADDVLERVARDGDLLAPLLARSRPNLP